MAAPSLPLRLGLAGACGLLLLGGIAGAAIVDEESEPASAVEVPSGGEETTTTLVPDGVLALPAPEAATPGAVVPAPAPVAGAGAGAGAEPGTTAAPATTATTRGRSGAPAGPGALRPPKPGSYVYEATTTSASGPTTERSTTTVEAAGREGAATIQAITIPLDLGGQQALTRNTVAWSTAGAVVRRSVITVAVMGQQQLDCVWQPAFPQYTGGLAVGKAWSFTTRCAGKVQGFDVLVEQRATRKVTGTATVQGPAGAVPTWTIADDTTVVVTSPFGPSSVRTVGTQQLAPSLGLPVQIDSKVEARLPNAPPEQSTVVTKLLSLP